MNRGIKKGLLLVAGCCMAAGLPDRALAASYNDDTADSYLSRIYTEAEDWISEGGAEDAFNGPGAAQTALEEDSALAGPGYMRCPWERSITVTMIYMNIP